MTLRITFEVIPFGNEERAYEIKRFDIFNKGRVGFDDYEYGVIEMDAEHNTGGLYDATVLHQRRDGAVALAAIVFQRLVLT